MVVFDLHGALFRFEFPNGDALATSVLRGGSRIKNLSGFTLASDRSSVFLFDSSDLAMQVVHFIVGGKPLRGVKCQRK